MRPESLKRLEDARMACVRIADFVAGKTKAEFVASVLLRSAVERQLEIIGESLGRAFTEDPEVAIRVPDLRKIVGLRNRLIHGYDEVDSNIVWDIVTQKLPELHRQLVGSLETSQELPPPRG
jgi:uncharacterized protein with HEPN domain